MNISITNLHSSLAVLGSKKNEAILPQSVLLPKEENLRSPSITQLLPQKKRQVQSYIDLEAIKKTIYKKLTQKPAEEKKQDSQLLSALMGNR